MTLSAQARAAAERFAACTSWEARARLLMQEGSHLPPLAPQDQTDSHLVHGCESQVWLAGALEDGQWHFRASTDARLLRGLLALLLVRVNGLGPDELQGVDLGAWFEGLGLQRQLTPSRSNGLNAVLQRMKAIAE
jgi:cysteine desulfuration protein SufE